MLKWRVPVHLLWFETAGCVTTLAHAFCQGQDFPILARLLHQLLFLFLALYGSGSVDSATSLRWLRKALAARADDDRGPEPQRLHCEVEE